MNGAYFAPPRIRAVFARPLDSVALILSVVVVHVGTLPLLNRLLGI